MPDRCAQTSAEAFATVAGNQDYAPARLQEGCGGGCFGAQCFVLVELFYYIQQGVDHGVAGDDDAFCGNAFTQQVVPGGFGWREVQGGDGAGEFAVGFFRPGGIDVAGTQAGFHVGYRDLLVIGGEAGGECGGGVAMDQHHVGLELGKYVFQPLQDCCGDIREVLAGLHDAEVEIRPDVEQPEYLVKHFAVLAGDANLGVKAFIGGQCQCQRGHFDGFGAGAEDAEGFHGVVQLRCFCRPGLGITGVGRFVALCGRPDLGVMLWFLGQAAPAFRGGGAAPTGEWCCL